MRSKIKFARVSSARFMNLDKDSNTVYFLKDTHKLFLGDQEYCPSGGLIIDTEMSSSSSHAVENKIIKKYIDDNLRDKQDVLVSGENIKTINGTSLLGSGNLDVSIPNVPSVFYELTTVDDVFQELQTGIYYAPYEKYFGLEGEGSFYVRDNAIIIIGDNGLTSIGDIISYSDGLDVYSSMTDYDIREMLGEKQDVLTFDEAPTSGSTNPVTSAGIKTYVDTAVGNIDTALQDLHTTLQDLHTALQGLISGGGVQ